MYVYSFVVEFTCYRYKGRSKQPSRAKESVAFARFVVVSRRSAIERASILHVLLPARHARLRALKLPTEIIRVRHHRTPLPAPSLQYLHRQFLRRASSESRRRRRRVRSVARNHLPRPRISRQPVLTDDVGVMIRANLHARAIDGDQKVPSRVERDASIRQRRVHCLARSRP